MKGMRERRGGGWAFRKRFREGSNGIVCDVMIWSESLVLQSVMSIPRRFMPQTQFFAKMQRAQSTAYHCYQLNQHNIRNSGVEQRLVLRDP